MSLITAFELGLWNAWILMSIAVLHPLFMMLITKDTLVARNPEI